MFQQEPSDPRNAIVEIEEREIEAEIQRRLSLMRRLDAGDEPRAVGDAFARIIVWCLEGDSVAKVGLRLHVVAAKLGIDVGRGMSNAELAHLMGFGRSAAHKLGKQFTLLFNVKGPHDRSPEACESYQRAWHESNARRSGTAGLATTIPNHRASEARCG